MGSRSLRRLDQPRPLHVIVSPTGLPHAIDVDGRRRQVVAIRDDWLVQDQWWTDTPIDRHYFELVVEPGRVMIAFYDSRTPGWFTHMGGGTAPSRRHIVPVDDTQHHPQTPTVPLFRKRPLPK